MTFVNNRDLYGLTGIYSIVQKGHKKDLKKSNVQPTNIVGFNKTGVTQLSLTLQSGIILMQTSAPSYVHSLMLIC